MPLLTHLLVYTMTSEPLELGEDEKKDFTLQWKQGVRVLGVSESFQKSDRNSIVAGVVMRGDGRIDGFGMCRPMIGGLDATERLLQMFNRIGREDIRAWMIGGTVISWFNIIDIGELTDKTGIPVVVVTYHESEGIDKYLEEYFPHDYETRKELKTRAGEREQVILNSGFKAYLNYSGMGKKRALRLVNLFTLDGRIPEPIRIARSLAASMRESLTAF